MNFDLPVTSFMLISNYLADQSGAQEHKFHLLPESC